MHTLGRSQIVVLDALPEMDAEDTEFPFCLAPDRLAA